MLESSVQYNKRCLIEHRQEVEYDCSSARISNLCRNCQSSPCQENIVGIFRKIEEIENRLARLKELVVEVEQKNDLDQPCYHLWTSLVNLFLYCLEMFS